MKHLPGVHEHEHKIDHHYEQLGENVFTILIIVAALFIPFAFILHFFPG